MPFLLHALLFHTIAGTNGELPFISVEHCSLNALLTISSSLLKEKHTVSGGIFGHNRLMSQVVFLRAQPVTCYDLLVFLHCIWGIIHRFLYKMIGDTRGSRYIPYDVKRKTNLILCSTLCHQREYLDSLYTKGNVVHISGKHLWIS